MPDQHVKDRGDTRRTVARIKSRGHDTPKFIDDELPSYESAIRAEGGPGGDFGEGTNPWIAGSLAIGSNKVWLVDLMHFDASSANVYYKIRHNHSGSASVPGGTIETFHLAAAGERDLVAAGRNDPLLAIRGPGTVTVEVFGARQNRSRSSGTLHENVGTRTVDSFGVGIKGRMV